MCGVIIFIYDVKNCIILLGILWVDVDNVFNVVYDVVVVDVYYYVGRIYDYYKVIFNRNFINDVGVLLKLIVYYGSKYNNVFWNGL